MNNYNYFDTFNDTFIGQDTQYLSNMNNNLFGPYEGYLKGNLFKNLYQEYKNYKPASIRFNSEKEEALFNLNQIGFAMHELNLYLDVYNDNRNALNTFLNYKNMYIDLLNNYEEKYGPINVSSVNGTIPFSWVSTNFPWEVM